jgi:hypothetical protein
MLLNLLMREESSPYLTVEAPKNLLVELDFLCKIKDGYLHQIASAVASLNMALAKLKKMFQIA